MATSNPNIMKICCLNLHYGHKQILKNISMPVSSKSVTAIVGPSGAGKSSLLQCLNLLCKSECQCAAQGHIEFNGNNILTDRIDLIEHRRKVGMVFQKPNPFPLSIEKNMKLPIQELKKYTRSQLDEILERTLIRVGLWDEVKDRLREPAIKLSGGQQQRLCIARALTLNPSILLLDEPTSSLDPQATQRIEQLLIELKKDMAVLIVTHNLAQAARIADHVAFMSARSGVGELIEFGAASRILTQPEKQHTAEFIGTEFI